MPPAPVTILVVEDHPIVLKFVQVALEQSGFKVLAAANGTEALQLEAAFDGNIHLVLSDVTMPDIPGDQVARAITRSRPKTPVILMSGYAEARQRLLPGWQFLQKPFYPDALLGKISEALQGVEV